MSQVQGQPVVVQVVEGLAFGDGQAAGGGIGQAGFDGLDFGVQMDDRAQFV